MQNRVTNSPRYLVLGLVGLVGLGLPLTVTIRVSRVSAMVSARFSVSLSTVVNLSPYSSTNHGLNDLSYGITRNSSGNEIANVNFLYDDIIHVLQNSIDSCIPPQIDALVMCGTHVYQI